MTASTARRRTALAAEVAAAAALQYAVGRALARVTRAATDQETRELTPTVPTQRRAG